jgi:hypothetical protein
MISDLAAAVEAVHARQTAGATVEPWEWCVLCLNGIYWARGELAAVDGALRQLGQVVLLPSQFGRLGDELADAARWLEAQMIQLRKPGP